jgi:F-box-like
MNSLSNDLLSYVLSFSFKDYAQISRVCRRFRFVTHQKGFWRCVGLYAFRHSIPKNILKDVDFFHGLEPNDPPFGWLGSMLCDQFDWFTEHNAVFLVHYRDCNLCKLSFIVRKTLKITFYTNQECYNQMIFFGRRNFTVVREKPCHITYFNTPILRKRIIENGLTTYIETRDLI